MTRRILKLSTATDYTRDVIKVSITWSDGTREKRDIPVPDLRYCHANHMTLAEYLEIKDVGKDDNGGERPVQTNSEGNVEQGDS